MRYSGKRKGAVLIIVLGVLAVLALLATTFATLQATERQVAHNYMDTVRAKLLAQSAVQDAEAKLREYFPYRYFNTVNPKAPKPWKYWGPDATETVEPMPDDKIEFALNPSFAIEADPLKNVAEVPQDPTDANVNPKKVSIEGRLCGLSGYQGGTYAVHGDQYVLKVTDTSGRLYVNDGVDGTANGKTNSVSRNMRRILNVLGDVLQTSKLGDKIIDNRPPEGYRALQDVLKSLNYDEALYNRVRNYITVYAWVDNNVVNPVPLNAQAANQMQTQTGVTYNRGSNKTYRAGSEVQGVDSAGQPLNYGLDYMQNSGDVARHEVRVFGLDALNPQYIEVVSRAPVNVNAASEEVLTALLTGLQGFFLTDRKRNNPRWEGDLYLAFKMQFKFYPETTSKGDEIGYLVDTFPIVNATGTGVQGISARMLAKEIVSCRNGEQGKYANYNPKRSGGKWFGGPFRTWHQFNAFVDFLARPALDESGAGFLEDKRMDIFKDYIEEGVDPVGFGGMVASDIQREYASQAIADVIKANFNPNCHLNELNPDANLFLIVDKTDLFVNSTEFCFMPTGYFEIEALGRILRPRSNKAEDAYTGDNEIAAQAKVTATFKLFDMYRESTQKQFYGGTLASQSSQWGTNNDKSIEIGPEPDNGYFPGNLAQAGREPADNEWDGYLSLPTMGGVFGGHGSAPKQPNTLAKTISLGKAPHQGAVMHVHFTLDHDCHDHPADPAEIGSLKPGADSQTYNWGDYVRGPGVLPNGGPYNPTKGTPGYHRLAKSFRLDVDKKTGSTPMKNLEPYAPSDLRIDGAYVERHSAPCYYNYKGGQAVWPFESRDASTGMISFWWKPSYAPERTGKIRSMWDMARSHDSCGVTGQDVAVWPFTLWYYPAHYVPATSETTFPQYWHNNMGKFNPSSIVGGSKQWHGSSSGNPDPTHEFGRMTNTLNHLDHMDHRFSKPSPLQAHHWTNTTFLWNLNGTAGNATETAKIFINGSEEYTVYNYTQMTGFNAGQSRISHFEKHDGGAWNHIRLGGSSMISDAAKKMAPENGAYRGNFSGDHTVDEFYAWRDVANPKNQWLAGRYYSPTGAGATGGGAGSQGRFTSQPLLTMVPYAQRMLAPPSNTAAPGGVAAVAGGTMTAQPPTLRILGMSWTWYGEPIDRHFLVTKAQGDRSRLDVATQYRALYDYSRGTDGTAGRDLEPKVSAGIDDNGQIYGPFYNDGFSPILNNRSRTPSITDPTKLKYYVQIEVPGGAKPILLASPVIDDITLFWDDDQSHLLSYVFDNRSF